MNKLTYIFILIAGAFMFASCSDSPTFVEKVRNSTNLAGFTQAEKAVSKVSDDSEYQIKIPVHAFGPSVRNLSGDITVTIEAMESSSAVKGTNFLIPKNTITLREEDEYRKAFYFTMLTEGIGAPIEPAPMVRLKVTGITANGKVIASGEPIDVTLNYACASEMQGLYKVTGPFATHTATVTHLDGLGKYVTNSIGGWFSGGPRTGSLAPLNYGVKFSDVCGNITVIHSDALGGYYSNNVDPNGTTEADGNTQIAGQTNSFTLKYKIEGLGGYVVTYTYVGPLSDTSSDVKIIPERNVVEGTLPTAEKL